MTMDSDDHAPVDKQNSASESKNRDLRLSGHVGFDSLPDQLVNKSVAQGFSFNILCVGETGLGKSTLMDTLFNTQFESSPAPHNLPGVKLNASTYELQESQVRLKLTVVNTVGFGDQINKEESYKPIVEYIDKQFENFLQEELKIKRALHFYHDTRSHACLYFIAPTGHSLKSLDLVTMKKLDSKVNIIPVIAKADTISKSELHKFKIKIMSELVSNGVQIYQFPTDDETVADLNSTMNPAWDELTYGGMHLPNSPRSERAQEGTSCRVGHTASAALTEAGAVSLATRCGHTHLVGHLPFAVVGSTEEVKMGNKMVRARQYPWGVVQVENENHCDFVKLREMLIRTNMEDLIEQTHTRHYELYRRCKLEEMGFVDTSPENKPVSLQETYETKRTEHHQMLQQKEDEMRQMFVVRVKEKESQLKHMEKELHERFDKLKRDHAEEKVLYEDKRRQLDEEVNAFNRRKQQAEDDSLHAQTMGKGKKK